MCSELQRLEQVVSGASITDTTEGSDVETEPGSESGGESDQTDTEDKWKFNNRKLMAEKGLYQKHSLDHPLLKKFHRFLSQDLMNENPKQEVENVARFLYFINPEKPTLAFVHNRQKTLKYLHKLSEANLTGKTQNNYLKSIKRFLYYHTTMTKMIEKNKSLHDQCHIFEAFISTLQKGLSKQGRKVPWRSLEMNSIPDISDTTLVLRKAREDFLDVLQRIRSDSESVGVQELLLVLYYLEAVLILQRLQTPGVMSHMTVAEWNDRERVDKSFVSVECKYKATAEKPVSFLLSQEEEGWFQTYLEKVRVKFITGKRDADGQTLHKDRFFISSSGRPIHKPSNDLRRLHEKFKLPNVTSQMAQRSIKKVTYQVPEFHQKLRKELDDEEVPIPPSGSSYPEATVPASGSSASCESPASLSHPDAREAFEELVRTHPVTLDGAVPDRAVRISVSVQYLRQMYEHWLKAQMKIRVAHVIRQFNRRLPSECRVRAWIKNKGWTSNLPRAERVLREWRPTGFVSSAMKDAQIQRLIVSQKWKGLKIQDTEDKGKGVFASRQFMFGEVVCDYHGVIVSAEEGQRLLQSNSQDHTRNMFFFKNSEGDAVCIDAHSHWCQCHPHKDTIGRRICHSSKHPNVRPRLFSVQTEEGHQDVILFIAGRLISAHEEIRFHYGAKKRSYRGEGLDLEWT